MSAFFAVDLATGQEMIKSIGQIQSEVATMLMRLGQVDHAVNLGELEEARAVAGLNQMVASDGDQSAMAVLEKFAESLDNAAAAVRQGMANYSEVEAATEQRQRALHDDAVELGRPAPRRARLV